MEHAPPHGDHDPSDDWAVHGHPRRWLILAILCICLVLVVASVSSLNLAIPSLQRALGATQTELQWIIDAYALVFAGLLLPAGALGDRFGRKRMLVFGLVLFGVAALVASQADSPAQVIALRAVAGIGAAFIMPATLSLLTAVFPPHERHRAIATWAGFAGAGGAIGLVSSGLLLRWFWWGSVFFVVLPIVAVALALILPIVPDSRDPAGHPLDPIGSLLSMAGLFLLLYAIIEGPAQGWGHPTVVGGFVGGAALLVGFVVWELRAAHPMLDPRLFRIRRFGVSSATITMIFFTSFGMFFSITQYLQYVKGYTPLTAGLAILPFAGTMVLVAPRGPMVAARIGVRRTMAAGMTFLALGALGLALVGPRTPYIAVAVSVMLMAVGSGLAMPSATASIMTSLPMAKAGVGSAVNDTTREVGGAVGIAVIGSVMASIYRSSVGDAIATLPPGLAERARDSVGAAVTAAGQAFTDPAARAAYLADIRDGFTTGMNAGMLGGAIMAFLGIGVVLRWYPREGALGDQATAAEGRHRDAAGPEAAGPQAG